MMPRFTRAAPPLLALSGVIALLSCREEGASRGIECLAPANAGGGWDLTCRASGRVLAELGLVPGYVRVINLPGAGGALAYAHVVARRRGDPNVVVASSPATTLRIAQGQYGRFSENDVRWLGAVAADYGIVAVRPSAPWRTLSELVDAWRRDPRRIVVAGGSAVGGQDHMKILLLARAAGLDPLSIRYVPFDGGGEAMTALLGGFVQVFSGDGTEARGQIRDRAIRVLAVLAPEPPTGPLAGLPTAREQGFEVDWIAWRGFYAPRDLPDASAARWIERLRKLAGSPSWHRIREETGLAPLTVLGPEFEALIREQVAAFRELSRELGLVP